MSFSFEISRRVSATVFLLVCVGIGGLEPVNAQSQGRPIEFSDPTDPGAAKGVNSLGAKSQQLPLLEDGLFKPTTLQIRSKLPNSLRPLPAPRGPTTFPSAKNLTGGNDTVSGPDAVIQQFIHPDILNGSGFGLNDNSLVAKQRTNYFGALNRSGFSDGTKNDSTDGLNSYDPFAAYGGKKSLPAWAIDANWNEKRRGLPDNLKAQGELSPDALRERKAQADQYDALRKILNYQTPEASSAFNQPATRTSGNVLGTVVPLEASRPKATVFGMPDQRLNAPEAPLAPIPPLPTGDSSLTPAPYKPVAKPKSVIHSAPTRPF